jgi:hypothetical protein
MTVTISPSFGLVAAALSLIACASDQPEIPEPAGAKARACPPDRPLVCVEKAGGKVHCFCSDRDELKSILDPNERR